jgi:hypothetical protein
LLAFTSGVGPLPFLGPLLGNSSFDWGESLFSVCILLVTGSGISHVLFCDVLGIAASAFVCESSGFESDLLLHV